MQKPFSVIKKEFTEEIIAVINRSSLDIAIIDMIIKQISAEVSEVAMKEADKQIEKWKEYEESIKYSEMEEDNGESDNNTDIK